MIYRVFDYPRTCSSVRNRRRARSRRAATRMAEHERTRAEEVSSFLGEFVQAVGSRRKSRQPGHSPGNSRFGCKALAGPVCRISRPPKAALLSPLGSVYDSLGQFRDAYRCWMNLYGFRPSHMTVRGLDNVIGTWGGPALVPVTPVAGRRRRCRRRCVSLNTTAR